MLSHLKVALPNSSLSICWDATLGKIYFHYITSLHFIIIWFLQSNQKQNTFFMSPHHFLSVPGRYIGSLKYWQWTTAKTLHGSLWNKSSVAWELICDWLTDHKMWEEVTRSSSWSTGTGNWTRCVPKTWPTHTLASYGSR